MSVSSSVTLLFIYACYACFFPDFSSQPLPVSQFSNPAKPSKQTAAIPTGLSEAIASREYYISYNRARQMLQSPNRKHNLRAYYRPGKLTIQNRVDSPDQNFSLVLKNEGILADGCLIDRPDPAAEPEVVENRLLIHHSEFTEEFINNEDGVRQNFIVRQAPAGTKELEVKLAAQGLRIQNGSENDLLLFSKNDKSHPRLLYRDLRCWDAQNQPLTAHMTGKDQQILITVDVRNAAYPVTIDPIVINGNSGNADALLESDQADALFGFSVASAGDVNGDGYSDMLAGAHRFDHDQSNEGVGVLILGAPNGLGLVTFLECNQPDAMMGFAVAGAGDVDGDGYSDVMAGARLYSNGQYLEGAAFIFKGSANGVVTANPTVIEGNQIDARLGHALSSAGDVNGDGFSDIALGAYLYDKGSSNEGAVMIHLGSANGVSIAPSQTLESDQIEAQFGISVACAGDVNGDGYADLIVGSRYYDKGQNNEGAAFIYQGSKDGLNPIAASVIESNQGDAWLGSAVAPAGDVNGDGFSDVLVGSYAFDHGQKDEGSVFVWFGRPCGLNENTKLLLEPISPEVQFGWSMAGLGDINGDGFDDMIVSANYYDNGQTDEGAAFVYLGSANGIAFIPATVLESNQAFAELGEVSGAGDINGDGFDDIMIGLPLYDVKQPGSDEGAVMIFHGSQQGIANIPNRIINGTQTKARFGGSVASAGDVNGDGYGDILIGEPEYDITQPLSEEGRAMVFMGGANGILDSLVINGPTNGMYMGTQVSGTGDLNSDGFEEILIGNPGYYSNGQKYEGAVFVFFGSANGINPLSLKILESNFNWALMGSYVGSGDIDGNGFNDIIAGAEGLSKGQSNEGGLFIYYSTISGISPEPVLIEGNIPFCYFGRPFSTGDINGDGYSDIIVGSTGYTNGQANEGAFILYLGSAEGINPNYGCRIEGNEVDAFLGKSITFCGDINGDGYGDISVGTHLYDAEKIFIYQGNGTLGNRNNLRLYNSPDLTTPINHTQFSQSNFGAGLFAESFTGRNKGKLVWETKPLAQGFSKGSNNRITNSTQSTGSQNAYSNLGTAGFELKNVIDKQGPSTKVRVRVKYDPVLALTGQSYGPWRYLSAYLMGNNTAPTPEEMESSIQENMRKEDGQIENETRLERTTVYPNPVIDRLNIDFRDKDQVQNLRILTASGSVVYQSKEFKSFIDVSKFSEGVYFLIITKTDGSRITRKILVSR